LWKKAVGVRQRRLVLALAGLLAMLVGACGGGSGNGGQSSGGSSGSSGGEERTVLVDYHHDEFASAFLGYYPKQLQVHPGDTIHFKQAWSGEPHSVTLGGIVDDMFEVEPLVEKYDTPDDARAGGVPEETIQRAIAAFSKLPPMVTGDSPEVYQAGAQPCFVPSKAEVPDFTDIEKEEAIPGVACPTAGKPQPAFDGTQGLYNSGFIPPTGESANRFDIPIAADAKPGTYHYFCNYHWTGMSGTIEIVAKDAKVPSQAAVNTEARKEITKASSSVLARVRAARRGDFGKAQPPLAGRSSTDSDNENDPANYVVINEFLPKTIKAKVGKPVTWTLDGFTHTISFNVPKYFPVFTVAKSGKVTWNPKSFKPVGWDVPEPAHSNNGPPSDEGRKIDVGTWDGKGGFHSSGALDHGDTFSLTFSKAGTYPYACVLHPQMVGTVEVSA
jgi:plastocyanin